MPRKGRRPLLRSGRRNGKADRNFWIARTGRIITRAKTQRTPSDGLRPIIPCECEGSKKISPGVYPEPRRRGRNDKVRRFAPWRPFDFAQDKLGAKNSSEF